MDEEKGRAPDRNPVKALHLKLSAADVRVREASCEDAHAVSGLITSLSRRFIIPQCTKEGARKLLAASSTESIKENMRKGFRYHVAEGEGRVVGVVGMEDNRHVYHLFVDTSVQKRGLGRRLFQVAREAALAAGGSGEFTVNSSNYAVGFYARLGFRRRWGPLMKNGVPTTMMVRREEGEDA
jgi:N-acetylglutamate synthase-like GNAT family acetyltransferase